MKTTSSYQSFCLLLQAIPSTAENIQLTWPLFECILCLTEQRISNLVVICSPRISAPQQNCQLAPEMLWRQRHIRVLDQTTRPHSPVPLCSVSLQWENATCHLGLLSLGRLSDRIYRCRGNTDMNKRTSMIVFAIRLWRHLKVFFCLWSILATIYQFLLK